MPYDRTRARARTFHLFFRATVACLWMFVAAGERPGAQSGGSAILVKHEFSASSEGWSINGDSGSGIPLFSPAGGNPGGCISGIDQALGETWYFNAPDSVLRQLPAAVNGSIGYSLKQSGAMISLNDDDVVIVGQAGRLSYRFPTAPGTDWTTFSVRLSADAGWVWNWNMRATQSQIEAVLAHPARLEIRGEYVTGDDQASLDNVVLVRDEGLALGNR